MFLVVLHRSGPEWDASKALEEQSGWTAHAQFMNGLVDAGFIVLGGPLADEYRVVHAVEADSEDTIRSTLAHDPWSETRLRVETIDLVPRVNGNHEVDLIALGMSGNRQG